MGNQGNQLLQLLDVRSIKKFHQIFIVFNSCSFNCEEKLQRYQRLHILSTHVPSGTSQKATIFFKKK